MAASDKPKSILDGRPVVNQAFPKDPDYTGPARVVPGSLPAELPSPVEQLEVVSSCPQCGSPVYGKRTMARGGQEPPVRHTCACRLSQPSLPVRTT